MVVLAAALVGPAGATPAGPVDGQPSAIRAKKCSWEWKRKKVVRWVWRNGVKKRIVRYRPVKVRVCRTIPDPVPAPARLGVKAYEFGFTLSAKNLVAGDTIIELNNQGEDAHDLHVQRTGSDAELSTPETEPGTQARIRLTTTPGTYRLWCSLPNHASWGMDTTFQAG